LNDEIMKFIFSEKISVSFDDIIDLLINIDL
jgi:hypothetical protein